MKVGLSLLGCALAASIACGSPASPTPPVSIAGIWQGLLISAAHDGSEAIEVRLHVENQVVTGTWKATSSKLYGVLPSGVISGTATQSTFAGTITFTYAGGPTCSGSFTGTAHLEEKCPWIEWVSPGFTTDSCGLPAPGNPLNVKFDLWRDCGVVSF